MSGFHVGGLLGPRGQVAVPPSRESRDSVTRPGRRRVDTRLQKSPDEAIAWAQKDCPDYRNPLCCPMDKETGESAESGADKVAPEGLNTR